MEDSKKKNLVIITNSLSSILCSRNILLKELISFCDVTILAPKIDLVYVKKLEILKVNCVSFSIDPCGYSPLSDLKTVFELRQLLGKIKPEIVFAYTIKAVIWGSLAARLAGCGKIYSMIPGLGYSFIDSEKLSRKFLKKIVINLYKKALCCNQSVLFLNPDDQNLFRNLKIILEDQNSVLLPGSGVDLDYFTFSPVSIKPIRFLMIARLLHDKGLVEYVEAARCIKDKYADVEFHLVGFFDDNPQCISQGLLNKWIDDKKIIFHGKLDDVRPIIAQCSVFVLPSYREGVPRASLEAMAMGRPVITTDAPGCRETVVDGLNGYLVPVKNIDALVLAMERFIKNAELIEKMGLKSRRIVEDRFDVRRVNQMILKTLELV